LPRSTGINRTIVVMVIVVAGAVLSMEFGTWCGLAWLKPTATIPPNWNLLRSLDANLALVLMAWGSIALAISSLSNRRAAAGAVSGLLMFSMYVLDYVGRFWTAAETEAKVSPFYYYTPFQVIGGASLELRNVLTLVAISIAACAVAHIAYAKRDL
jgi:hypothetical protein